MFLEIPQNNRGKNNLPGEHDHTTVKATNKQTNRDKNKLFGCSKYNTIKQKT